MGFGVLIDNTIKELTCLHEIMSRNLIEKLVINEMAHVLQANVFIPLALCICDKQKKKKKIEQGTHDEYEDSNICEGLFDL